MTETTEQQAALADEPEAAVTKPPGGAERQRYWQEHIERWRSSGMTQKDYCRKNGLKWSTFHYWRKRLQELSSPVSLIQVALSPGRGSRVGQDWPGLVLLIGDNYRVQVGDEFNPATLARLVQTLGHL
jgi:hypothetical protein